MSVSNINCVFQGGSLQDCDLSNAILRYARFEGVTLYGARFSAADLCGGEFYLVLAMDAQFDNAKLCDVKFVGGSFIDVNFAGADLSGAVFVNDNMGGFVDISGADFSGTNLFRTQFQSVFYTATTIFPADFDPVENGLILKDEPES